jgi:hypothetical protein
MIKLLTAYFGLLVSPVLPSVSDKLIQFSVSILLPIMVYDKNDYTSMLS